MVVYRVCGGIWCGGMMIYGDDIVVYGDCIVVYGDGIVV